MRRTTLAAYVAAGAMGCGVALVVGTAGAATEACVQANSGAVTQGGNASAGGSAESIGGVGGSASSGNDQAGGDNPNGTGGISFGGNSSAVSGAATGGAGGAGNATGAAAVASNGASQTLVNDCAAGMTDTTPTDTTTTGAAAASAHVAVVPVTGDTSAVPQPITRRPTGSAGGSGVAIKTRTTRTPATLGRVQHVRQWWARGGSGWWWLSRRFDSRQVSPFAILRSR